VSSGKALRKAAPERRGGGALNPVPSFEFGDPAPERRGGAALASSRPGACLTCAEEYVMVIKILPNDKGSPAGKLADAELHFTGGELEGLKLVGFAIWERKSGSGRNVTFPARQYSVNGERRSFALLRPIAETTAQDRVRDMILQAYAEFESAAATV
jgi:hypothetical protein